MILNQDYTLNVSFLLVIFSIIVIMSSRNKLKQKKIKVSEDMNTLNVPGDGACMFNSIALSILYYKKRKREFDEQAKKLSDELRKIAVTKLHQYIEENDEHMISVLAGETNSNAESPSGLKKAAERYVKKMKKSCEWGGQIEIHALSEYVKSIGFKGIRVYDDNKKMINGYGTSVNTSKKYPLIRLRLSGVAFGGLHFDPLLPKKK